MKRDRLRKSLLSQIGSKLFSLAVAIGIGGWTARYLGPSALGILSYVSAIVGLLGPLGNLGVRGSLSALLCSNSPLPGLLGTALCIELVGTVLVALVLVPVALLAKDPVIPALLGLAVLANLFNSAEVFEAELLNRHRGSRIGLADFTQMLFKTAASSAALLLRGPLLLFGALPVFQSLARGWILYQSSESSTLLGLLASARWPTARKLIERGLPIMLSGLSVMIYSKSDLIMLRLFTSTEDVGLYSVAVQVIESMYFLPMIIRETFLPRLAQSGSDAGANQPLKQLFRLTWILGISMSALSFFVLPSLLTVVFGSQYAASSSALKWLAPSAFAVSLNCAMGAWLIAQGFLGLLPQRSLFGAIINILLNLLFIPRIGIYGAALATSISYIMVNIISLIDPRTRKSNLMLIMPFF